MTDYTELVKALRFCARWHREDDALANAEQAAAAIEALQAQLPKRGEIVRCRECKHYNAGFECLAEGYGIERDPDWFCANGERKVQDADT